MRSALGRAGVDPYLLAILSTVGVAALLPARGGAAHAVSVATQVAIGLLFFLYGARLSPRAALDGARQWRLHLTILLATFALFPLLGVAAQALTTPLLGASLAKGVLFLTLLPSTVQSSIAFTSIAGGNVAAAVCAASFSSLIGIVLTPLLAAWLIGGSARIDGGSAVTLVLQLLLPFLLGQLARRWIAGWISRHKPALTLVDRGSILLVVYGAFSEGVVNGVWSALSVVRLCLLLGVCVALLFAVLGITTFAGKRLGFARADRIVLTFCGSKKSLASGLPMAAVLFPASAVSLAVLPLMLFHQIQLMACTVVARRMAAPPRGAGNCATSHPAREQAERAGPSARRWFSRSSSRP
ncbi:bile acid:sodium symporter [Streptacidiphilus pinicola]|uniref:Bile acid:sodium symporter n=1 Tax=Streptacidiphilus pinicola TaxID=2219663 RepID=A0A2X0KKE9_9ACTN|nr:bile acid:sodium symporter family protein [Streptacidiphilus pinicola]RAG87439.1 bile acid:sodium symporter [Streptacidiphilus pinicola]